MKKKKYQRPHLFNQARFQMHWDNKILQNCHPSREAMPLKSGQISDEMR
jgi:hypothetical protein